MWKPFVLKFNMTMIGLILRQVCHFRSKISQKDLAGPVREISWRKCVYLWVGLPHQESRDGTVPKTQEAAGWIWRGSLLQLEKDRENKCMQVCMFVIVPMHVLFFLILHLVVCTYK